MLEILVIWKSTLDLDEKNNQMHSFNTSAYIGPENLFKVFFSELRIKADQSRTFVSENVSRTPLCPFVFLNF